MWGHQKQMVKFWKEITLPSGWRQAKSPNCQRMDTCFSWCWEQGQNTYKDDGASHARLLPPQHSKMLMATHVDLPLFGSVEEMRTWSVCCLQGLRFGFSSFGSTWTEAPHLTIAWCLECCYNKGSPRLPQSYFPYAHFIFIWGSEMFRIFTELFIYWILSMLHGFH